MTVLLAAVGDTHIGSTVGLCTRRVALDDGGAYEASKSQRWLWSRWRAYWQRVAELKTERGAQVVALMNGDLCDRNRHGHYQLWSINRASVKAAVLDCMQPLLDVADLVVVVRGTEAHTGESAEMEEWLAGDIGAVPDEQAGTASWWYWEATLGGYNVVAAHHPGTSSTRPWTQGGGANRRAAMLMAEYYGQRWQPNLGIFGHVHHNEDSFDNHPVRCVYNRAFSLRTAFDHRQGRSTQGVAVGGLIAEIDAGELRNLYKLRYPLPRRKPWRMS